MDFKGKIQANKGGIIMRKRIAILSIVFMLIVPVLPAQFTSMTTPTISVAKEITGVQIPIIKKRYKKIKKGMSFQRVKKILKNKPTALISDDKWDGDRETEYEWFFRIEEFKDVRIYITFTNGKVTSKLYMMDN